MKQVYLHIGLRKTASTFLQHNVFPHIPNVLYSQNTATSLSYKYTSGKKILLISDEDIPGWPYYLKGTHKSFFDQFKYSIDMIRHTFKDPKIIVCFREPADFIYSNYKQYLHEGGVIQWKEFFSIEEGKGLLNKEDYKFSKYTDYLHDKFNEENLFIYDYEYFKNNNNKLAKEIVHFINPEFTDFETDLNNKKKSNPSVNYRFEKLLMKLNLWNSYLYDKRGVQLKLRLFNKVLNPRVLCQYILPKFMNKHPERNIDHIKEYYRKDWNLAKEKMQTHLITLER